MKIAYVITRADAVGGASIHVRDLARAMRERGHEVLVFLGGSGPVTDQLARAGVPFRSLRFLQRAVQPLRDGRAYSELVGMLRDFQPDLVSTHTAKAGWLGRAASRRLGLRVLYTPHGWPFGRGMSAVQSAAFAAAERTAASWAARIICVCEHERHLALRKNVGRPGQLCVVYNGVRDVPAGFRAEAGRDPARLVSVARFEHPKDHQTLIEALAALRAERWELDLVGDGPLEADIRSLAGRFGLKDRVRFLGYQPDPERTLAQAQLFVLSSRAEAFPRSVLEAMRAGLPVVASDVGGVGEAVEDGVNGFLVSPGEPRPLAARLGQLLTDASERKRLGFEARLTYESRFRFELMAGNTAALYDTVIKEDRELWKKQWR